jgi:CRP-like cAMP-binding protein
MRWPAISLGRWAGNTFRQLREAARGLTEATQRAGIYQAAGRPNANFLDSLHPAERQHFAELAHERTFARGARLMLEGESADYVILILGGWVQISVLEKDGTRVIEKRGPGQLVGERGALHVNVRSATVIALETVHAQVMRTEDFANYIGEHPRVLDIVENQIYDRLTEDLTSREADPWTGASRPETTGLVSDDNGRQQLLAGENCTVVLTDIVAFGARNRNDDDRRMIRRASLEMTRASLGALWEACIFEDRGDGLLIVIPPEVPTARVMQRIDQELPTRLRRHNHTYSDSLSIRMRVAVHVGPVIGDPLGMSGSAIIRTARMVEAAPLKRAMASTGVDLGIIVSPFVHETTVEHVGLLTRGGQYKAVEIDVKETRAVAWMRLAEVEASGISASNNQGTSTADERGGQSRQPEAAEVIDSDELLRAEWSTVNDGIQAIYKILGPPPLKTLSREAK